MRDRKEILLARPELFILRYFPHKIEKLEDFHLRLIQTATEEERSLILYPAQHGKTTLVGTLLPIWSLCKDPNSRTAIIAKNEQDAKGVMRAIHAELQGNEELVRDFGPFHDSNDDAKAWTIERIDVAKKNKRSKEGTIQLYGSKGNVLGKRFDWVICDDVVTEKNSATPEQRASMREWFNLGVETMPEYPWSRLTVCGTLFDPEDLYNDLLELVYPDSGKAIYVVQREDAIVDEETHETLWEERWPWERLMGQKAKQGTLDFNKRYRNIAVDKSRMVFKEEYIKGGYIGKERYPGCLDKDYVVGESADNWRRIAGFDPALGTSRVAKFCAHVTLGVGSCVLHERCFWVIDLLREQLTMPQQVELILLKHQEYDLFSTVIEVNGYQAGLEQAVNLKLEEQGLHFRIDPHHTSKTNKPDPEIGVASMSRMIENGQLHIPAGDVHSRKKMQQLVDELVQWPSGRTTDTVMALWFAWKLAQESAPRFHSYNRLHEPKKTMWSNRVSRRALQNPAYASG